MRKIQRVGVNFGTIAEAIAASSAGDLVQVLPGVYEESDLVLKNGVNIEFMPGAEMTQSAASIAAAEEYTAFKDDGADVVCSIGGRPKFTFYGSSDLIELTGTSAVNYYGKPEYSYTDSLSWTSKAKITFEAGPDVKVYRAILSGGGAGAPVADVVENTLGVVPVWSRGGTGIYDVTSVGAFPINKTSARFFPVGGIQTEVFTVGKGGPPSDDKVRLQTYTSGGSVQSDKTFFYGTMIEILVFP